MWGGSKVGYSERGALSWVGNLSCEWESSKKKSGDRINNDFKEVDFKSKKKNRIPIRKSKPMENILVNQEITENMGYSQSSLGSRHRKI